MNLSKTFESVSSIISKELDSATTIPGLDSIVSSFEGGDTHINAFIQDVQDKAQEAMKAYGAFKLAIDNLTNKKADLGLITTSQPVLTDSTSSTDATTSGS